MRGKCVQTDRGLVEYRTFGTEGPYIVVLHGSPGGFDQVEPYLARLISDNACRIVAWSRPGYGYTPIDRCEGSFEHQAALTKALMDFLNIDKAVLYGISAGGAVAMHFAAKYSQRCYGIILESSVAYRYAVTHRSLFEKALDRSLYYEIGSKVNKFMAIYLPRLAIRLLLSKVGNLNKLEMKDAINDIVGNKKKLRVFRQIVSSFSTTSLRLDGMKNDLYHLEYNAHYPLAEINVPTLVIHGTRDSDVSIEHADYIMENIKTARMLEIYGGTHILPLSNRTRMINNAVVKFLESHTGKPVEGERNGR